LSIGRAETLTEGDDVAIFAIGRMVDNAGEAVKLLADEGIKARLINARFVQPLDELSRRNMRIGL